jgi:GT2 family glycosyltransferase
MSAKIVTLILNWNGLQDTLNCIESVLASTYSNNTLVIIDNNSVESVDEISVRYPDVVLIRNPDNLGYSGGNNIGFGKAIELGADYIWVLNNDTEVDRGCLKILANRLVTDTKAGAVSNLILYMNAEICWYAGGELENGLSSHRGQGARVGDAIAEDHVDFVSGCSFLVRAPVVEELIGFDEDFFCYCEDVDLSVRIKKLGYMLAYEHDAIVYHKVSASSGHLSNTKIYYKYRNKLLFLDKHGFPFASKLRWYVSSLRYVLSLTIKHRRPKLSATLLRALWDGTFHKVGPR